MVAFQKTMIAASIFALLGLAVSVLLPKKKLA